MTVSRNVLKTFCPLLAALALSSAAQAFDLGGLLGGTDSDVQKAASSAAEAVSGTQEATATTGSAMADGLVGMVSNQLGISKNQAIGGLGALVGYASSSLPPEYADQLNQMFPAFNKSGSETGSGSLMGSLMNNVSSMDSVKTAFSGLGMDPSMVDQFTPLIESYVGDNGGGELVGALQELW